MINKYAFGFFILLGLFLIGSGFSVIELLQVVPPAGINVTNGWGDVTNISLIGCATNQILNHNGTEWVCASNLTDFNYIEFNTSYVDGNAEGRLQWNTEEGTLEVGLAGGTVNLQIGEEFVDRVKNVEGETIQNCQVVFISGATGSITEVQTPIASNLTESEKSYGVATEEIANNGLGYITIRGKVRGCDTSSWSEGDDLYLSGNEEGNITNVRPPIPNLTVQVGTVLRSHATEGVINVHVRALKRRIINDSIVYSMFLDQIDRQATLTLWGGVRLEEDDSALDPTTNISFITGSSKLLIAVNSGVDLDGSIQIIGQYRDRDTDALTNYTQQIDLDGLSTTVVNGREYTNAYLTDQWFTNDVIIATTNTTINVDVAQVSFDQAGDVDTFFFDAIDVSFIKSNKAGGLQIDFYSLVNGNDRVNITNEVNKTFPEDEGTANVGYRFKRSDLGIELNGSHSGWFGMATCLPVTQAYCENFRVIARVEIEKTLQ